MNASDPTLPQFARTGINLASAGLGAKALYATDDFFAPVSRMLDDAPAVFFPDRYDDNGKWMDGWESRRKRGPGHDLAVVRLAVPGHITGFDVDTSHFTGNYAPACSIEGAMITGEPGPETEWTEIVRTSALGASTHHFFQCDDATVYNHVRLHIFPDGGVARLRVYGNPAFDAARAADGVDLASALVGARIVAYSDAHYGTVWRLLTPGRGANMGDGWETRRRREPGNDWIIVKLGARGVIDRAVVDTAFYKGNFPESFSIHAADLGEIGDDLDQMVVSSSLFWDEICPRQKLSPDAIHEFHVPATKPVTHVRLNIFPDGGVSRLRLFGKPVSA